jgi:CheY-like chemotaxis protein
MKGKSDNLSLYQSYNFCMADNFRVLIVDDHQEIRTTLRANLEAIETDLDLFDVPSGEEAIVEVVGNGLDLLIADYGLPGLSGIDLYKKLKATYPDMQVILITGLEDEEVHQEIADAGAEAFFFKPLKMPEFLNAVRRTMGLDPVEEEEDELPKLTKKILHADITSRIADLRGELGAISILIIEQTGVISAETGIVPDTIYQSHVMPLLLQTFSSTNKISQFLFSSTNKISQFLGKEKPDSVWYFSGEKYDLFWSHIDSNYGMMLITNPITQNNDLTWVMTTLDLAIQELTEIIQKVTGKSASAKQKNTKSASTSAKKPKPAAKKSAGKSTKTAKNEEKVAKAELPKSNNKGSNGSAKSKSTAKKKTKAPDPEDSPSENEVHEFWKAATLEEEIQRIDSPDSLSFDQAQKLGFIPGEENSGS